MKLVNCPTCRKLTELNPENSFRPFCSERCRLIDLGQWADESYKIATDDNPMTSSSSLNEAPEDDLN